MSQHIEWANGLGDWTVNPGEWVDGYGSRNGAVAIWSGDGDGVLIEFASQQDAAAQLRRLADAIEKATDTSTYDVCRWCEARIVLVPEYMGGDLSMWVHAGELGAETPDTCDAFDTEPYISPAHKFVDGVCSVCENTDEDDHLVCVPTE